MLDRSFATQPTTLCDSASVHFARLAPKQSDRPVNVLFRSLRISGFPHFASTAAAERDSARIH